MADVFISYKREERARVQRIAQGLQELGLSVWFDASLEGGGSFSAQINREVRAAKCVLVCWTPAAAHSEWVIGEAEIGRTRGVLAPVFLASTDLPPPFNTLHAFNLMRWNGDHGDAEWLALVDRIGSLVGRAGLRHIALALAAGESVRVLGENLAGERDFAVPSGSPRASISSRGLGTAERMGQNMRSLMRLVSALVFGPVAFLALGRPLLAGVNAIVVALVALLAWASYQFEDSYLAASLFGAALLGNLGSALIWGASKLWAALLRGYNS
jgi:hypothetical protein